MSVVRRECHADGEPWPARACRRAGMALCVIAAAAGLSLFAYVLTAVPGARREADRLRAQEIDRENRDFCQALGIGPATERFQSCVRDLMQIRQHQRERWAREYEFM